MSFVHYDEIFELCCEGNLTPKSEEREVIPAPARRALRKTRKIAFSAFSKPKTKSLG